MVEKLGDKVGRVHSLWNCMVDINVGKKDTTSMQITKKKKGSALQKVFSQIENFRFSARSPEKVVSKQNL